MASHSSPQLATLLPSGEAQHSKDASDYAPKVAPQDDGYGFC